MLKIFKEGPKRFIVKGDLEKASKILMVSVEELLTYPQYYNGKIINGKIIFEKNVDAISFLGLIQSQVKINKIFGINV